MPADPRRNATRFSFRDKPQEESPDFMSILAVMFGMMGLLLKVCTGGVFCKRGLLELKLYNACLLPRHSAHISL